MRLGEDRGQGGAEEEAGAATSERRPPRCWVASEVWLLARRVCASGAERAPAVPPPPKLTGTRQGGARGRPLTATSPSTPVPTDAFFLHQYMRARVALHHHGHAHAKRAHEGRTPVPRDAHGAVRAQLTGVEEADALIPGEDRLERAVELEGQVHDAEAALHRAVAACAKHAVLVALAGEQGEGVAQRLLACRRVGVGGWPTVTSSVYRFHHSAATKKSHRHQQPPTSKQPLTQPRG